MTAPGYLAGRYGVAPTATYIFKAKRKQENTSAQTKIRNNRQRGGYEHPNDKVPAHRVHTPGRVFMAAQGIGPEHRRT